MTYKKTQTVFYEKSASAYLTLLLFYFDANIEILILIDDLFLINGHFPNFLEYDFVIKTISKLLTSKHNVLKSEVTIKKIVRTWTKNLRFQFFPKLLFHFSSDCPRL